MLRPGVVIVVMGMFAVVWASRTDAQMPDRGERAIFGGGVGSADQILAIRSNVGATFHDPIGEISAIPSSRRVVDRAWFGHASSMLTYRYDRPFLNVRAAGGGFSYYQPRASGSWITRYNADAGASTGHTFALSPRSSLSLFQGVSFRPTYFGAGDPGGFAMGSGDFSDPSLYLPPDVLTIGGRELGAASSARLGYDLSQRVSFDTFYGFDRTWIFDSDQDFDRLAHRASATVRVGLTRYLRLHAGYRFTRSRGLGPNSPVFNENSADIGLDYGRGGTIRLSRRTELMINGGASGLVDSRGQQRYFLIGNVALTHEIGRSWRAAAGYHRNVDFITLFQEPILSNTATAEIGGLITRRLQFRAGAAYSTGTVGFVGDDNGVTRAAALAQLQTALGRYLALGVNYTYYRHDVGGSVTVRSEFAGRIEGQSVRVYLSAWAPIFHRVRRP